MTLRKASASLICAAAALVLQSCVEYVPVAGYPPTPQPPSDPNPYAGAPAAQPVPVPAGAPAPANPDDTLVAPIALYPDPLIALILPASTVPGQVSAAAAYLIQYGDPTQIGSQPWDPSVQALAHYPTVVAWMADNMAWTSALGAAFSEAPSDVMDAVQRMRARALAAGTLTSTPQQQVYSDGGEIEIYPAQPGFLYVPVYDDSMVYSSGPYDGFSGPFVSFGDPYPEGGWLSFYFDWGRHRVWAGDPTVWRERGGWLPPRTEGNRPPPGAHAWHPPSSPPTKSQPGASPHGNAAPHPRPMPGAPVPQPTRPRAVGPSASPASSPPVPRTTAPAVGRPQLNGPAPSQGEPAPKSESRYVPPQGYTRTVQAAPGGEQGAQSAPLAAPKAPPSREYAPAARGSAPPPAPHESAPHAAAPAAAPAPAPAPSQETGRQAPQK